MPRRRRRRKPKLWKRALLAVAAIPALYLLAALIGALVSVNRDWSEPDRGITVYLASNGVHADLILPAQAEGLDWTPFVPPADFAAVPPGAEWIAFGAGEREVYLETPRWRDIKPRTVWSALSGGGRVMHVEWVRDPTYAAKAIRLRPAEYRRLWSAIRAGFELDADGSPIRISHPGYGQADAFYEGVGKASAIDTCNQWIASRLRLGGIKAPVWSPFVGGLTWRYRTADQST